MGCRFNGATFNRTWRGLTAATNLPSNSGFNGATFNRTWRAAGSPSISRTLQSLQWSHVQSNVESSTTCLILRSGLPCFNGATFNRTWRVPVQYVPRAVPDGFNGATFNRTWRGGRLNDAPLQLSTLQWSHVQSNVERPQCAWMN